MAIKIKEQKRRIKISKKWRKLTRHLLRGSFYGGTYQYDIQNRIVRTFKFVGEYDWTEKPYGRSYGHYEFEDELLSPNLPPRYPKRLGKNRRRNTNGGWRYGSYNRKDMKSGKRQFVSGKSSREFSRNKESWWENGS